MVRYEWHIDGTVGRSQHVRFGSHNCLTTVKYSASFTSKTIVFVSTYPFVDSLYDQGDMQCFEVYLSPAALILHYTPGSCRSKEFRRVAPIPY